MSKFKEEKLKNLGFVRQEWEDEFGTIVDHKLSLFGIKIEITNLSTVEITTQGQYVELARVDSGEKLEQLINLLSK